MNPRSDRGIEVTATEGLIAAGGALSRTNRRSRLPTRRHRVYLRRNRIQRSSGCVNTKPFGSRPPCWVWPQVTTHRRIAATTTTAGNSSSPTGTVVCPSVSIRLGAAMNRADRPRPDSGARHRLWICARDSTYTDDGMRAARMRQRERPNSVGPVVGVRRSGVRRPEVDTSAPNHAEAHYPIRCPSPSCQRNSVAAHDRCCRTCILRHRICDGAGLSGRCLGILGAAHRTLPGLPTPTPEGKSDATTYG